ncbi:O-methyltransferase [Bacillus marinisedimentorum]|uniref:O-methyltransferase n=1 Tax=Bacillus marinisedimentorum TaxID=1821260 RepID=UPI00087280FB|nr:O-methyltransferase [Bacillus marinisedimentorum]
MVPENITRYVESIIPERSGLIEEMERYAKEHRVPIMELTGIETLLQLLRMKEPDTILEIGTAIGYSAIRMAQALPNVHIYTIERDEDRYKRALDYINRAGLEGRIHILLADALEAKDKLPDSIQFGAIFIDAAKGQYARFFELYSPMLSEGGTIISDNVLFKGLVAEEHVNHKRIRPMVEKLKKYNKMLMGHEEYDTAILPVGDGIAISKKR